jgi:hypothetical protein
MRAESGAVPASPSPDLSLEAFESLDFDVEAFDHEAHVFIAWLYVIQYDPLEAIERYRDVLKQLTASIGMPDKYHETVTWFFIILIAERARRDPDQDWDAFRQANADLLRQHPGIILDYYAAETLDSADARRNFVLPNFGPLQGPS